MSGNPVASFPGAVSVDLEQAHAQHAAFRPMGTLAMTPLFNYYGFINERGGDENHGYTQIFKNGILEATKAQIVSERDGQRFVGGIGLETHIFEVFSGYIDTLRNIGVPPPLIIMLTLEGVENARYAVRRDIWDDLEPLFPEALLLLPQCVLEDYGEVIDHHRAIRPAFDALWNAIGYSRAQSFNEEGMWIGAGA